MIKNMLYITMVIIMSPVIFILWVLTNVFFTLGKAADRLSDYISDNIFDKLA